MRTFLIRFAAVALLVVASVGVPVWLIRIGGMPFTHLDPGPLLHAVRTWKGGDPRVVVAWFGRVALLLAWAGWCWTIVCIVVELRSWRTGRSPTHLPGSRSLQWMAACLVGTAFALGSVGRAPMQSHVVGGPGSGGSAPVPVVQVLSAYGAPIDERPLVGRADQSALTLASDLATDSTQVRGAVHGRPAHESPVDAGVPSGSRMHVASSGVRSDQGPGRTVEAAIHIVAARQTLWSVAEQRLGSAMRWREIAELNYGRLQADGGELTDDHWISPGWQLHLPLPRSESGSFDGSVASVASVAVDAVDAVDGSVADVAAVSDPLSTAAAKGFDTPADPEGRGSESVSEEPLRQPSAGAGVVHETAAASVAGGSGQMGRDRLPRVPVVPLGAGIIGVGITDVIDRLRRVQQRRRTTGARIPLPGPLLRQFEQRLRTGGGAEVLQTVEDAATLFCDTYRDSPGRMGVIGVEVCDATVGFVLDGWDGDENAPLASPFTRVPGTSILTIGRDRIEALMQRQSGSARPPFRFPTLVTVGTTDDRLVMVHPEGLGSLVIEGPRHEAEGIARGLALELATSRWSSTVDLVLVGFGAVLERFAGVSVVSDASALVADLSWRQLRDAMVLEERGFASTHEARHRDVDGSWDPTVVICGPSVPVEDVRGLMEISRDGICGISVIAVGTGTSDALRPAYRIDADADASRCRSVAELFVGHVEPQRVEQDEVTLVTELLDVAGIAPEPPEVEGANDQSTDQSNDTVTDRAIGTVPAYSDRHMATSARVAQPDREIGIRPAPGGGVARVSGCSQGLEVEVSVLGPVEIRGAARAFTRAWSRELVVYLAMHPRGASNDSWATALWPERIMAPSSLHSTASVARRSLGKARDGTDHLPRSHGHLALAGSVGTDWDRFLVLADGEDCDRWKEALTLVRGRPLSGIRSTDWSILDGTAPAMESAIVDLSGRLAGACLRSGDSAGTEWAARRGLLVSPYDERLYRMLLRAADAAGNPGGVESVMAELVRIVADEIEPVESVHPSTMALYRSLSRRRTTGAVSAV